MQLSYKRLADGVSALPFGPGIPIVVVCHSGARSSTAASILQRHGFTDVHNVAGGMVAWTDAGLPAVDGQGQVCG